MNKTPDPLDILMDLILSDDSPMTPEDEESVRLFDKAIAAAKERLERSNPPPSPL